MEGIGGNAGCSTRLGSERIGFAAHCPHCREERPFVPVRVAVWRHAVLSVVTGGLWLVVWGALLMGKWLRPWRCAVCGWHKPEFRPEFGAGLRKKTAAVPQDQGDRGKKVQPPTVE